MATGSVHEIVIQCHVKEMKNNFFGNQCLCTGLERREDEQKACSWRCGCSGCLCIDFTEDIYKGTVCGGNSDPMVEIVLPETRDIRLTTGPCGNSGTGGCCVCVS